jgi:hypothetical protein
MKKPWMMHDKFGLRAPHDAEGDLWQDDAGAGDGVNNDDSGGADDDYDPAIHDDPDHPEYRGQREDGDGGDGGQAKVSHRPGAAGFTPDAVAAAVTAALKAGGGQQQQQQPQFDQAAFRKQIGYRDITEQDVATLLDPEKPAAERAKALQDLLDARERSVLTIANALHAQLNEKLGGFEQSFAEQRRESAKKAVLGDVVKAYPALKPLENSLPEIFEALRQTGYRPKSPEEGIRMIASFAQQTIRKFNPTFSLKPSQAQSRRPMAGSVNTGGAAGGPGRPGKKEPFNDLWD